MKDARIEADSSQALGKTRGHTFERQIMLDSGAQPCPRRGYIIHGWRRLGREDFLGALAALVLSLHFGKGQPISAII